MNKNIKKAFTLAELMIVFTVIGVLSAILLPAAFHSSPDENVAKFKKANNDLYQVIGELVSNEKYYLKGDLGIKPDESEEEGHVLDGTVENDKLYFCKTLADVLSKKSIDCYAYGSERKYYSSSSDGNIPNDNISTIKGTFDTACKNIQKNTIKANKEIVTTDGVVWFQHSSNTPFGAKNSAATKRLFGGDYKDDAGFDRMYKVICIDIDGVPVDKNGVPVATIACDNKKDICPFGYGIRADGKIIPGARADAWIAKSIQKD